MPLLLSALARGVELRSDVRTVDGLDVHARHVPGPGLPTVVLVHGMAVSSRYFIPTMRELAGSADIWAPDLAGHGLSDRPPQTPTVRSLADNLLAWMEATIAGPTVLVANSFGCQIAVEAAIRATGAVRALVLNGPTTDPRARSRTGQATRWLRTSTKESLLQAPLLLRDYIDFGPCRIPAMAANVVHDAIEDKLPRVVQATVVVCGEHDPIVPRDWAEEVVRLLPRGRLVLVPGAAHTVNFTHPAELASSVREVLASA